MYRLWLSPRCGVAALELTLFSILEWRVKALIFLLQNDEAWVVRGSAATSVLKSNVHHVAERIEASRWTQNASESRPFMDLQFSLSGYWWDVVQSCSALTHLISVEIPTTALILSRHHLDVVLYWQILAKLQANAMNQIVGSLQTSWGDRSA